jgi:carbamoyltransferase
MLTIGIICYQGHSSSAAIVKDGKVILATSEERFTRVKHDDSFPINSLNFILQELNLEINSVDEIAIAWSIKKTIRGQLKKLNLHSLSFIFGTRDGSNKRTRFEKFFKIINLKNEIRERLNYKGKISYRDHHLAHATCSFVQSEKNDTLVFVADGMGESAATTIYHFDKIHQKVIYQDVFPNSLGIFYSTGTQYLNFMPDSDEFKVMGLAAYGKPSRFQNQMKKLYSFKGNKFSLTLKYFSIQKEANQFFSENYKEIFGQVISVEDRANFAFALQSSLEEIVIQIIKLNNLNQISKNFCSAGGVFLNCLLNQKLRESKLFDSYTFFPVADDNGTAIGAAQLAQLQTQNVKKIEHLYLGPEIKFDESILPSNLKYRSYNHASEIAKLLADGSVIAWAQGRMEFGHRSLGNRSILADPRKTNMKNTINNKIKYREDYRPFAPSIINAYLDQYFEEAHQLSYNFMIETLNAKAEAKQLMPAVVHEDGTSRVQSISRKENELYFNLLEEFYKLTGCPALLNTSFNLNGMPIVLSFKDAIDCFVNSEIDYLVVEDKILWK